MTIITHAETSSAERVQQISNEKISAWKRIIYPGKNHALMMHRHDHDRVLIALTDGTLKVTSDKGNSHLLTLKKNKAYYFSKDRQNELHSDENITTHPIEVIVVELK